MRKFPKAFTRRKSTANAFEDIDSNGPPATEHTFKVFDRGGDSGNKSFDGGAKLGKPTSGPGRPKPAYSGEENMFENLGNTRASGGSNSNTASTTDNSSRLSAASTTASSTDLPHRDEHRSAHDKSQPHAPKATSAFSLKNAGRSLSWGRNKPPTPTMTKDNLKELPSLPPRSPDEDTSTSRSRAVTSSSYASTATPPKLEDKQDLGLSLGGDFSDMFAGFGKRKSVVLDVEKNRTMSRSPEALPVAPATRANRFNSPGNLTIDRNKEIDESPYSWSSQNSHDGLMSNRSPPIIPAAIHRKDMPPPVPQHNPSRVNTEPQPLNSTARPGAASADGLRRSSALAGRRQSTLEYTPDPVDQDAKLLRESMAASRQMNDPGFSSKVRDSWALPSSKPTSYKVDDVSSSSWRSGSNETTPKPKQQERQPERQPLRNDDDNMFDSNIATSASLANRYQEKASAPPPPTMPAGNRVMTPAQFERYKQDKERLRSIGGQSREDEDDEEEDYDDDEDEAEKAKERAKLRRKQEAHMAVYRQQMMKVTGETGPRPGMLASQSSPNLVPGRAEEGEEEDEEVPLAILQAHGFPNRNKPPMRSMGSNPNLRASTMTGGGEGGRLPVFARHLPQDPYLGAGLQSPMHRESMAFAGGAPSVSGGQRGAPTGGLVGVIVNEERSRAMRRGSPNAANSGMAGTSMYGMPIPGEMGPPGMNPMMMGQGDPTQQQLTQQMQQFMQMQMQFMQMMTSGQSQAGPPSQAGPMQGQTSRPSSSHHLRPGSGQPTHQRAMTMMEPNAAPWMQPGGFAPSIHIQGYTPSIAPSERSNVGMPGRYRPVSHMPPPVDNKSRLSTMSGALPNWENKTVTPAIRVVKKSGNASDEDDEEGWEEMAKKREKKKSMWKSKRDTTNFKDMLHFN